LQAAGKVAGSMTATRILSASPATSTLPQGNLLDNLPRINQRREVETDNIHPQFGAIGELNYDAHHGILNFAARLTLKLSLRRSWVKTRHYKPLTYASSPLFRTIRNHCVR
jgi:hypothetical protein